MNCMKWDMDLKLINELNELNGVEHGLKINK